MHRAGDCRSGEDNEINGNGNGSGNGNGIGNGNCNGDSNGSGDGDDILRRFLEHDIRRFRHNDESDEIGPVHSISASARAARAAHGVIAQRRVREHNRHREQRAKKLAQQHLAVSALIENTPNVARGIRLSLPILPQKQLEGGDGIFSRGVASGTQSKVFTVSSYDQHNRSRLRKRPRWLVDIDNDHDEDDNDNDNDYNNNSNDVIPFELRNNKRTRYKQARETGIVSEYFQESSIKEEQSPRESSLQVPMHARQPSNECSESRSSQTSSQPWSSSSGSISVLLLSSPVEYLSSAPSPSSSSVSL
ncbi:hypothetical protein GQ42DRAFT_36682 [Ramicandelaber brevisporus]|nr:hypothetical protein GQ42DRAFT_36682 [Ramicandelaber brevisporus]